MRIIERIFFEGGSIRTFTDIPDEHPELWTVQDLQRFFKLTRSSVYRLIRTEGFPKPTIKARWVRSEIEDWATRRR